MEPAQLSQATLARPEETPGSLNALLRVPKTTSDGGRTDLARQCAHARAREDVTARNQHRRDRRRTHADRFPARWDGFRALIRTEREFRVRRRRGWNMTPLVPEFAELPARGIFDGELVAFGCDGLPSFPAVCQRLLHRDSSIALTYLAFDVLGVDGQPTTHLPWSQRRVLLEGLDLNGPSWFTPDWFDDGEALFQVVVDQGLEGIVAKRLTRC